MLGKKERRKLTRHPIGSLVRVFCGLFATEGQYLGCRSPFSFSNEPAIRNGKTVYQFDRISRVERVKE